MTRIDEVKLVPNLASTLLKLKALRYRFAIVTNQSVISRGLASYETVESIHTHILDFLKSLGVDFDLVLVCPHTSEEKCFCRKPRTGLIDNLESRLMIDFDQSYMVGDQETDILFGRNLGMKTILISPNKLAQTSANFVVGSLGEIPMIIRKSFKK